MKMPQFLKDRMYPLPPQPKEEILLVKDLIEFLKTLPGDTRIVTFKALGDYQDDPTNISVDITGYNEKKGTLTI